MKTKFIDKGYAVILGEYGVIARLNLAARHLIMNMRNTADTI